MASHGSRVVILCMYLPCQHSFEVIPSRAKSAKFCSMKCAGLAMNAKRFPPTLAERFWQKVNKEAPAECWLWQASKGSTGYGFIWVAEQDRLVGAHVVSWFLQFGVWPPEDTCVLHNCPLGDNPACVNPAHLWLGTRTDNGNDMVAKGRNNNGQTRITALQVEEMTALYATGEWTYPQLATKYGVSMQSAWYIVKRRHVFSPDNDSLKVSRAVHSNRVISDAQCVEMAALYATGLWTYIQLGAKYGVAPATICRRLRAHKSSLINN